MKALTRSASAAAVSVALANAVMAQQNIVEEVTVTGSDVRISLRR